jgi:hypothetical protein
MGVLLFGDHLKMYETFVEAFSQVVVYLRRTGAENLVADTPYQQMLLAFYVVAFCVCMIFFSNLVSITPEFENFGVTFFPRPKNA